MSSSALLLATLGISLSFFPKEIISFLHLNSTKPVELVLQLIGALYFAMAMLNWMAKGSYIGGIYNRPIAIANLSHILIGGMAIIKGLKNDSPLHKEFWFWRKDRH